MRHEFWLASAATAAANWAAQVGLLTVSGDIALAIVRQCFEDDGTRSAGVASTGSPIRRRQ